MMRCCHFLYVLNSWPCGFQTSSPGARVKVRRDCVEDKRWEKEGWQTVGWVHPSLNRQHLNLRAWQSCPSTIFLCASPKWAWPFSHWQHVVVHLTTFWWVRAALTALGNNLFTLRRILSLGTFSVKLWVGLCEAVYRPVPHSVVTLDRHRGELMRIPGIIQDFRIQPRNAAAEPSDTSVSDGTRALSVFRSSSANRQWSTLLQNASIRCPLIVVSLHVYPSAFWSNA